MATIQPEWVQHHDEAKALAAELGLSFNEKLTTERITELTENLNPALAIAAEKMALYAKTHREALIAGMKAEAVSFTQMISEKVASLKTKDTDLIKKWQTDLAESLKDFDAVDPHLNTVSPQRVVGVRMFFGGTHQNENGTVSFQTAALHASEGFAALQGEGDNQRKGLFLIHMNEQQHLITALTTVVQGKGFTIKTGTIQGESFRISGIETTPGRSVPHTVINPATIHINNVSQLREVTPDESERNIGLNTVYQLFIHISEFTPGEQRTINVHVVNARGQAVPNINMMMGPLHPTGEAEGNTQQATIPENELITEHTNDEGNILFTVSSGYPHAVVLRPQQGYTIQRAIGIHEGTEHDLEVQGKLVMIPDYAQLSDVKIILEAEHAGAETRINFTLHLDQSVETDVQIPIAVRAFYVLDGVVKDAGTSLATTQATLHGDTINGEINVRGIRSNFLLAFTLPENQHINLKFVSAAVEGHNITNMVAHLRDARISQRNNEDLSQTVPALDPYHVLLFPNPQIHLTAEITRTQAGENNPATENDVQANPEQGPADPHIVATETFGQLAEAIYDLQHEHPEDTHLATADRMKRILKGCDDDASQADPEISRERLEQRKNAAQYFTRSYGIRDKFIELIDKALGNTQGLPHEDKDVKAAENVAEGIMKELEVDPGADIFWTSKGFIKSHADFVEANNAVKNKFGNAYSGLYRKAMTILQKEDPVFPDIVAAMLMPDQYQMRRMMREARVRHGAEKFTHKNVKAAIERFAELIY